GDGRVRLGTDRWRGDNWSDLLPRATEIAVMRSNALPVHGMSRAAWPYALRARRIARPRLRRRRPETPGSRTSREAWSEYHCGGNNSATFRCGRGTHEDISASHNVRPCVALRLASVRQIFERRAQLVNVEYKAPVNLARLRHSTVGDQL